MAHDLLVGTTSRDWSCGIATVPASQQRKSGKSSAELWDEAESARLHRPVKYMSDKKRPSRLPPPSPPNHEVTWQQALIPVLAGMATTAIVLAPFVASCRKRS